MMASRRHLSWPQALTAATGTATHVGRYVDVMKATGALDQVHMAAREVSARGAEAIRMSGGEPRFVSAAEPVEVRQRLLARSLQLGVALATHSELWLCRHAQADANTGVFRRPLLAVVNQGLLVCGECFEVTPRSLDGEPRFSGECDVCGVETAQEGLSAGLTQVATALYAFMVCDGCRQQVDGL